MRKQRIVRTLALCATLAAIGCSDADFDSVTEVKSPRIVDVVESPVHIGPGETTTIAPVVVKPSTYAEDIYLSYQLCIFDAGAANYYRCPDDLPIPGANILAEGTGDTFSFEQSVFSNDDLHALCDILAGESESVEIPPEAASALPQCVIGLPVGLRVKMCIGAPDCADEDARIARKTTYLLFEENAARSDRNLNPAIDRFSFDGVELLEDTPHPVALTDCSTCEFPINIEVDVNASAQDFTPVQDGEEGEPQREELQSRWFATTSGMDLSLRYYREGITTDEEVQENKITLDPEVLSDGEIVDLWVVLRDSRMGSDVVHRQIVIEK